MADKATPSPDLLTEFAVLLKDAPVVRQQVHQSGTVPASAAEHDLNSAEGQLGTRRPIERIIRLVDLWSLVAAEQLHDVGVLLEGHSSVFGIFPNIRGVIEHGAWVTYLLDNQVAPMARARRAALATLESEEKVVAAAAHMTSKDDAAYVARKAGLDKLKETLAEEFPGFDAASRMIDGEAVAKPSEVIKFFGERFGDERQWFGMYEYLCGTANHPSENPFEFFGLRADGTVELGLSSSLLNRLVRAGISPFVSALRCMCGYLSWPSEPVIAYEQRATEVLDHHLSPPAG
jgi:hypothetical protein